MKSLYVLFGILLSIVLLLTTVEVVAFNRNHYLKEYEKHGVPDTTSMDMNNLQDVTRELLAYLKGKRENLDMTAIIKGREREVFGEREKLHMVDVKKLFITGRWIRNIGIVLLIGLLIFFVTQDRGWKRDLSKTLMLTTVGNIGFLSILFLLMYLNFTKYFDYFHYIFFDNDLWILNPETDIMIQMLPEAFFYNTAMKIVFIYIFSIAKLGLTGFCLYRKTRPIASMDN